MKKNRDMQKELRESAHKVWLAGLGALAVAGEEGKTLFRTLVERGEEFEEKNRSKVDKMKGKVADAKTNAGILIAQLGSAFDEQVTGALHRLGVPTRNEISHLTKRVEDLTKSIEKMKPKAAPAAKAKKPAPKPSPAE